jgi:hypothetical protein
MSEPVRPWPPLMRFALLLSLTLGVMVTASAAQGAVIALNVESVTPTDADLGPFKAFIPYAREQEAAMVAQQRAMLNAIEQMAAPRVLVLGLLASITLLIFVTSLQIRWSVEAPEVTLARRLAGLSIAAAVLRTIDGAQSLVIERRAFEAFGKAMLASGIPEAAQSVEFTRALTSVASIGWTATVVTLFMAVSSYFQSDRVQAVFAPPLDHDED